MRRFSVLVSGGGTNLQSLIDHVESGDIDGEIASVIASRADAFALTRAQRHGIPTHVHRTRDYETAEKADEALLALLQADGAEFVVLAGYLSILGKRVVQAYPNRIINIHPALLPRFGGKGYYGERVHAAVLEAGETSSGATVHFVDEGTDTGPIILQGSVPVLDDDTPATLQARVMTVEHELLPKVVAWMAQDRLRVEDNSVKVEGLS